MDIKIGFMNLNVLFPIEESMSLRKEKAARLKINVLDNTIRLIGRKSFDDLYVDEICAKVKISKVTLFKYFPQKDDILLYYFRIWCLKRAVELRDHPREASAGILFLFERLGEDYEAHPGIILSLVAYLADLKRPPKPFPVKAEEKKLLFPEVKDIQQIDIQSLDQMFERFALEAIFKKEITKTSSTRELMYMLTSLFYGSVITAQLQQVEQVKYFFKRTAETMLKGLK
jgi:AcrR family transcriptional regulator